MHGIKKLSSVLLLTSLLAMTSCVPDSKSTSDSIDSSEILPPLDYEIDPNITNTDGGVYYEIFVRSYADSNDDGIGDLNGIKNKIPYLKDLGVKGLWLTPINPSPSYHGYDVTDYKAIHEDFGTLQDFDNLIQVAAEHGIDIIIDLVINHSSKLHPWFIEGKENFRTNNFDANDPTNKANWYDFFWNNGVVDTHGFFGEHMPEFLLDNSAVRDEIASIATFWLQHGVKGFRLDATSHFYDTDTKNIAFLKWFDNTVKAVDSDAYIVGEAWINSFNQQKSYYSGIDSFFNFAGANVSGYIIDRITSRAGSTIAHQLAQNYNDMYAINENGLMAMFLTNHDMDRSSQMFLFDFEQRQKLASSIYLLTPGVPFMYYGEEIALKGSRRVAQTDANRRLPMIWKKTADTERTDNPPQTDYDMFQQVKDGVQEQLAEPFSLLNHYKKVISVRNSYPWIKNARVENYQLQNNFLTSIKLTEHEGSNFIHVIHNTDSQPQHIDVGQLIDEYEVTIKHDIFTVGTRATLEDGILTLAPYSSVILERK